MTPHLTAGIDAGSRAIKAALYDPSTRTVIATASCDQGTDQAHRAQRLLDRLLTANNLTRRHLARLTATGYGRHAIPADAAVTEITCHAAGVRHLHPNAHAFIDIGGQDSKFVHLHPADGRVTDFSMNDRCAAGTGRFLEIVAQRLGLDLPALSHHAALAAAPSVISSMCVVFAESEIIGLMAAGETPANIAAGVHNAIAERVAAMRGHLPPGAHLIFTGGVARLPGMAAALARHLGQPVHPASDPCMTGAIGAALQS